MIVSKVYAKPRNNNEKIGLMRKIKTSNVLQREGFNVALRNDKPQVQDYWFIVALEKVADYCKKEGKKNYRLYGQN